jgi:hypothetical protein
MANVSRVFGSWASSGPGHDFPPGGTHGWVAWGYGYGDALSVTAHPVAGPPVDRALAIENVRSETHGTSREFSFTVRNVGSTSIPGYGVGVAWVSG